MYPYVDLLSKVYEIFVIEWSVTWECANDMVSTELTLF